MKTNEESSSHIELLTIHLTILTQPLNSAVSNSSWENKKSGLLNASLLPINQSLSAFEIWDEAMIETRSEELFERAMTIWPGPSSENP